MPPGVIVNGEETPTVPFHEGTVIAFEEGRSLHLYSQQEASDLAAAAAFVAANWVQE